MTEVVKLGTIKKIYSDKIEVEIEKTEACGSCALKSACGMGNVAKKRLLVAVDKSHNYKVNDTVELSLDNNKEIAVLFFAFGLPLILLLIGVLGVYLWSNNEIISGIFGIMLLIPYYFGLLLDKNKLASKYACKVRKCK